MSRTANNENEQGNPSVNRAHSIQSYMLQQGRSFSGREANCCFFNTGPINNKPHSAPRFATVSSVSGLDFMDDGRGLALVDWDHDGDVDIWFSNRNAPRLRFARNDLPQSNSWLAVRLVGNGTSCNQDAIGSKIEVKYENGRDSTRRFRNVKTLNAGSGFLSQSTKWINFGLGKNESPVSVDVVWADGTTSSFENIAINQRLEIHQATANKPERVESLNQSPRKLALEKSKPKTQLPQAAGRVRLRVKPLLPAYRYDDFEGATKQIPIGKGQPVLITFWGGWCPICNEELNQLAKSSLLTDAGIDVYALAVDQLTMSKRTNQELKSIVDNLNIQFSTGSVSASLRDDLTQIRSSQLPFSQGMNVPISFLIDRQGRLTCMYNGPLDLNQVVADANLKDTTYAEKIQHSALLPGSVMKAPHFARVAALEEAHTLLQLARYWARSKRVDLAGKNFRLVQELLPERTYPYYGLGTVYLTKKKFELAESEFRKAIDLVPEYEAAWFLLANALIEQGKLDEAKNALNEAIKLKPDFKQAKAVLARLNQSNKTGAIKK